MSEKTSLLPMSGLAPQGDPPDPRQTLETMTTVLIVIVTVGVLFFAREFLVPIAIAVLLSFVLSPLVKGLRKLGLGKRLAVGIVVLATFLFAVGIGVVLAKQIADLAAQAPKYQAAVMRKVDLGRAFAAHNALLNELNATIAEVAEMGRQPSKPEPAKAAPPQSSTSQPPAAPKPTPVEVIAPPPGLLTLLRATLGMVASPLASAAFVAVFIIFILMQREDLRNRFIRLAGSGDLQRTTLAMNDAARRLSRYFLVQVLLNMSFGIVVGVVLSMLGVPSPVLWGIVSAFMRFIPYVGAIGSALFPVLMAAAADPGWSLAVETALFFLAFELFIGQVVEPLVYGHHTGISPIAIVAAATFWTWLWGPIGLVLSTPMTVCLVVMGRHVERLSFLNVLLGDAPPLSHVEIFYQRMLAGDPAEILDRADEFMKEHTLLDYSDQIAMRALLMAQSDLRRGALDERRQLRIRDTMRDLAETLIERDEDQSSPTGSPEPEAPASLGSDTDDEPPGNDTSLPQVTVDPAWARSGSVFCFAGRTALDEAAAQLLVDLLNERGIGAHVEPAETLAGKGAPSLDATNAQLLILSFLDADLSMAQARFAVRRLRRRIPNVPLLAGFWMAEEDDKRTKALCFDVRCDLCAASLPQAIRLCLERADVRASDDSSD